MCFRCRSLGSCPSGLKSALQMLVTFFIPSSSVSFPFISLCIESLIVNQCELFIIRNAGLQFSLLTA